jgi:TolB-like protein/DNA-binding winged helix-turn-helix (wHTH) protein/Tfp pilus assembly protein PilF
VATEPIRAREIIRIGEDIELDVGAYQLRRDGRVLKLERIPMDVLIFLVDKRGSLVSREQLINSVWGADVFLDADNSLNGAIRKIRQALKDDPENPRFIQTVTGRGYRFIAPVSSEGRNAVLPIADFSGPHLVDPPHPHIDELPGVAILHRAPVLRLSLLIGLLTIVMVGVGFLLTRKANPPSAPPLRSIAVLPLDNLSGDASQDYFVDGMTDELITDLAKINSLRVISRTSAMRYKGTHKSLPEIARELNADGIVEGSVTRSGSRVRITAQLIRASTDQHLWAETYERDINDVLRLQGEVAQAIAQQVSVELTPQQQARLRSFPSVQPEAYEDYLRGHYFLIANSSTPSGMNTAKTYFDESIRKDPGFALAHVDLANSYLVLGSFRRLAPQEASTAAEHAIKKALELDPNVGEAHDTLAMLSWHRGDWALAQHEFEKAIALAPSYGCAHADYSLYLSFTGRRAEALDELTRSRELEPSSSFDGLEAADYYQLRDYPEVVKASQKDVAASPDDWLGHYFLGIGYEASGKAQEAIAEYQKATQFSEGDMDAIASLAHIYAVLGRRAEAEKMLDELLQRAKATPAAPYMIATIYAGLGNKDKAFEYLDEAYREHSWDLPWQIKADIRIDNLRSDPRFQRLLIRLGLNNNAMPPRDLARND